MRLDQSDKDFLFSTTEISDIFFSEYFSQSSGDYIKVYLYLAFLSKFGKDIKLTDLSKKLNLPLKLIQDAIKYWEDLGLLLKKTTGYTIVNIQEKELYNLYSPKLTSSPEGSCKNAQNQYRAKAVEEINNSCFQGIMSPSWYNDIDLWFSKYGFDEQVMIALFKYCFERSALHRNYVQTVAESWSNNNIRNFTDLDKYYQKQEKLNLIKKTIAKKLGFNRPLTQYESAYVEKWVVEFGYGIDIIEIALKKTTTKSNPNFDYLDKLISDWHDRHFTTPEDINSFLLEFKEKKKTIQDLAKKTNYNNYEQRNYDNLDSLYANQ